MASSLPVRVRSEAVPIAGHTYGKRVTWDTFRMPDGSEERFLLLDSETPPCLVVPVSEAGNLIVLRHFRYGANAELWEFPGGTLEPGQSLEDGARRELLQETGYAPGELLRVGEQPIWFDPGTYKVAFAPFLARGCRRVGEPNLDPTERLTVHEISVERWQAMVRRGEVVDAKTLAITLLAIPHLDMRNPWPVQ